MSKLLNYKIKINIFFDRFSLHLRLSWLARPLFVNIKESGTKRQECGTSRKILIAYDVTIQKKTKKRSSRLPRELTLRTNLETTRMRKLK